MIRKEKTIKCSVCGRNFSSEHYHGGSIEHNNYTNDYNMEVFVNRSSDKNFGMYRLFLDSITLDNNLCNIKNHTYDVGMQIFECRLLWLSDHDKPMIYNYLESQRGNIKKEFNKIKNFCRNILCGFAIYCL